MPLDTLPLEHAFGSEPFPAVARPAETRDRMFDLLEKLDINMSLDINRSKRATQAYVYRYKGLNAPDAQYKIRTLRPGWSRIWRVK
jgi:hypothetical protein